MWFISQTGKKLKQLASRSSKQANQLKETEYFQKIDKLLKQKSNIVSLPTLESFVKSTSTSPDECQTLSDVLFLKLDCYIESNRRNIKMFKTLVIIDYILLNGVSIFIDIFNDRRHTFQMIAEEQKNLTLTADKEFQQLIVRKAQHIANILKDKQLRLEEKERVQSARILILKKNKQNLYNTLEQQNDLEKKVQDLQVKELGKFGKIQKYINDRLEKLAIALIGLIDEDCVLYANSQLNKEFMDKGQSIIADAEDQSKQTNSKRKQKSQQNIDKQQKGSNQMKAQPKPQQRKVVYQNLLGIEIELL